jgi:hypothetical protein
MINLLSLIEVDALNMVLTYLGNKYWDKQEDSNHYYKNIPESD